MVAVGTLSAIVGSPSDLLARELVPFNTNLSAGTILVRTSERQLYLVQGDGTAVRYRVAVGRPNKQWVGKAEITGKYVRPAWGPPAEIKRDKPSLPDVIPGGSLNNPLGERAMTLSGGEYAIHGTNRPSSIGTFASYGCIRMLNADIADLFDRVAVGSTVVVAD
ncbi:L,D-transpeptidase [Microvirga antarctica]|uniref:L,D-transpeptidase n=1 Tax=Microvirga antarctica TaxID=2819233 RepID=UPI001FE412C6|nr:L,D-transpeptidase [Microvirga antarctica]